jgi:hypothetical protein
MHKAMAESSAALEKLGKENEKSLAEYRSAADRVKAQYDADRANLAEMNRILSARLDAKEKDEKKEVPEKEKVPEKEPEKIYEFVPIVASQEGASNFSPPSWRSCGRASRPPWISTASSQRASARSFRTLTNSRIRRVCGPTSPHARSCTRPGKRCFAFP